MRISNSEYGALTSVSGLIVIVLLIFIPSLLLIIVSFLRYTVIQPISFAGLANYKSILNDRLFWLSLKNTVIYSGGVTALTAFGGMALAIFISRITRAQVVFRTLSMFPWAVPLVISGFIWKWMFDPNVGIISYVLMCLGVISEPLAIFSTPKLSMMAVIVADAWVRIPFMMIFTLAGIESIPQEMYEVAEVDGADFFDSLWHITLPLIKRVTLVGLLVTTMFSFRTIDVIFSMTSGGPAYGTYVLGFYAVDQMWKKVDFGTSAAASIIMFILVSALASVYLYWTLKEI